MGSLDLPELEKKVVSKCSFIWSQNILNVSERILACCETEEEIKKFLEECEGKVKKLDKESRIAYNTEIQKFGGDEYGYVWFFYSDLLDVPVKMALRIDVFEKTIAVGKMDIPSRKEEKKLTKHLNNQTTIPMMEVKEDG